MLTPPPPPPTHTHTFQPFIVIAVETLLFFAGYKVFGLQFYGECWSGHQADTTYDKHGPSVNCWEGVGTTLSNFVYVNRDLTPKNKTNQGNIIHLVRSVIFISVKWTDQSHVLF